MYYIQICVYYIYIYIYISIYIYIYLYLYLSIYLSIYIYIYIYAYKDRQPWRPDREPAAEGHPQWLQGRKRASLSCARIAAQPHESRRD